MTKTELLAGMALLEIAVDKAFSEQQVTLWFNLLGDLEGGAYMAAVKRCLQENEYPTLPAPGRIRRYADEFANGIDLTPDEAYALVRECARKFDDDAEGQRLAGQKLGPKVWSIIEGIGGFRRFTEATTGDCATLYAQFRDAWQSRVERLRSLRRLTRDCRPALVDAHGETKPPALPLIAELCAAKAVDSSGLWEGDE